MKLNVAKVVEGPLHSNGTRQVFVAVRGEGIAGNLEYNDHDGIALQEGDTLNIEVEHAPEAKADEPQSDVVDVDPPGDAADLGGADEHPE